MNFSSVGPEFQSSQKIDHPLSVECAPGSDRIAQSQRETVSGWALATSAGRRLALRRPVLGDWGLFLLVVSMISSFQAFDIIKVMTDGGPVNATTMLLFYIYEQGFVAFNAGRAAAASVFLFLAMLVVTVIQLRLGERRVHYG